MGVDAQATTFMSLLVLRLIKGVCIIDTFIVVCTIHSVLHLARIITLNYTLYSLSLSLSLYGFILSLPPSFPPSLPPSLTQTHTLSLFLLQDLYVWGESDEKSGDAVRSVVQHSRRHLCPFP